MFNKYLLTACLMSNLVVFSSQAKPPKRAQCSLSKVLMGAFAAVIAVDGLNILFKPEPIAPNKDSFKAFLQSSANKGSHNLNDEHISRASTTVNVRGGETINLVFRATLNPEWAALHPEFKLED